jgi:hypothetical protein
MARVSSDVILACLDDIRAGRRTLDECVAQHPEAAAELRELAGVAMAIRIDDAPAMDEAARLRGRAELLAAITSNGHQPAENRALLARALAWRPRWLAALGAGLSALAAGGAVAYAAYGAPPDSPLYPVRQAVEVVAQAVRQAPPSQAPASAAVPVLSPSSPPAAAPSSSAPTPPSAPPERRQTGQASPSARPTDDRGRGDDGDRDRGRDGGREDGALPPPSAGSRGEAERGSPEAKARDDDDRGDTRGATNGRGDADGRGNSDARVSDTRGPGDGRRDADGRGSVRSPTPSPKTPANRDGSRGRD